MRISAGEFKGRKVAFKSVLSKRPGNELRPTSTKVREALFDILRPSLGDAAFLDLYAGTGAVGLEALSRGARRVVLVEAERRLHDSILKCLDRIGVDARAEVVRAECLHYLKRAAATGESYDIIFADPPYASPDIAMLIEVIGSTEILAEGGSFILEHATKTRISELPSGDLVQVKDYRYGDTTLTRFRKGRTP